MRARALLFLFCLVTTLCDAASIARLRAFVRETQSLHANFTQVVYDAPGRQIGQASGEFSIVRPGHFRWSVEKPYRQLLVGDGERVWIYDPDLNQVITRKADRALGNTPAALLSGREEVEAAFDWRELPAADGLEWLSAVPKDKDAAFRDLRLGFDSAGLAALEVFDNFGQRTLIRFSRLERNPKLSPELFRFTPPAGADVVSD